MFKKIIGILVLLIICAGIVSAQKVTLREDGIMLVDGKPFFPIGTYRDPDDSITAFEGIKEAGFNLTHEYYFEHLRTPPEELIEPALKYLDNAHTNGVKVFMGISRRAVKKHQFDDIAKFVSAIKDHPALLTWYSYDEPLLKKIPLEDIKKLTETIKKNDPNHPISLAIAHIRKSRKKVKPFTDTADIIWVDPYPIGSISKDPIRVVGDNIAIAQAKTNNKKPVWSVIQAFQWDYLRKDKTVAKDGEPTVPSRAQFRFMNYLALATNAKGLIYYWGSKRHYHMRNDAPKVWKTICTQVDELKKLQPFLVAVEPKTDYKINCDLRIWTRQHGNKRIVALVNYFERPSSINWTLPWKNIKKILTYPDSTEIKLQKGALKLEFEPIEVKMFMLEL